MDTQHKPLDSNHFETCPHCQGQMLTETQLEKVAERAATKAVAMMRNQFYQGVGSAVVGRFFWLLGLITVSVALWMNAKGLLK